LETILTINNLTKKFGYLTAVKDLSFTINKGNVYGILGPNGSGKSTTLGVVLNVVNKTEGNFHWFDGTISTHDALKKVGAIIERPNFYPYMSAYQNLKLVCRIKGVDFSKVEEKLDLVGLLDRKNDKFSTYSLGMKQRLGLAIALLNEPDCLVLDEPFSGLDPMGIYGFHQLIKKLSKENKITILISSHIVGELTELCDTLYVISKGRIIRSGLADELYNESVSSFKIMGTGFENIELKRDLNSIKIQGGYIISASRNSIPGILRELSGKGVEITACIPQTDLKILFEDKRL